jgi:hypothetical protein
MPEKDTEFENVISDFYQKLLSNQKDPSHEFTKVLNEMLENHDD